MTQQMTIRLAQVEEAEVVAQLLHDFNTEYDTPSPGVAVLTHRLHTMITQGSSFAIVAGEPPIACGLITARPNIWYEGQVGSLDEMYVAPEHRNNGIGSAILAFLDQQTSVHKIDAIEINVDEADTDAQRFYERNGYSSTEPATNERAFYYFKESVPPTPTA